jgi:cyanophycin synthetase
LKRKSKNKIQETLLINITGTNGKTTTARILDHVLSSLGYRTGLASSIGLYINGKRIKPHDQTGKKAHKLLLSHMNKLDILIVENVLRHIRLKNFFPKKADYCLITNVSNDHIHQVKSRKIQDIADIKETLIRQNKINGFIILNADNKYTLQIAKKYLEEDTVILYTTNSDIKELEKNKPKAIYFIKKNNVFVKKKNQEETLVLANMHTIPCTLGMKVRFNVENLIAAIAILDNLSQLNKDTLYNAIKTFTLDFNKIPGRFNLYDFKNFMVILDNAHNPKSYHEAFKSVRSLPYKRLVSVIKASSTRTSDFIERLGEIAARYSDLIYVKESFTPGSPQQKRMGGTIASILKKGILNKGFNPKNIQVILSEEEAVETAIRKARKKDLILIFGYRIEKLNKLITRLQKS